MAKYTRVYSPAGVLQGLLENASVQYTLKEYPLHSAKITLPADDPANNLCTPRNEVEIFDGDERVERFRILTSPEGSYKAVNGTISYNCEHVLGYLNDSVMFGYHEIGGSTYGGSNENTRQCIEYILARQTTVRWQLGTCAFSRQFQYSFENERLLPALLSIPKQFDAAYRWTFDTTTTPWTINLVAAETDVSCEMRYNRNMQEIKKSMDSSTLCTRLYALGYGEGNNQLTIKDVNNNVPYLDADTAATWGVIEDVWVDSRFEIAASLKNRAQQILAERKNPLLTYKVNAIDLYRLTGDPFDKFYPGKIVRVNDQEHGIQVSGRVTEISKKDVCGKPGEITVTIANKSQSVADTLAEIASRTSVNELYAQGATNIYEVSFQDNADKDHAATMKVQIPTECVRINKMRMTWTLSAFRSYSQGAEAGGGSQTTSSAGGGSQTTSSEGGATTRTSSSGGGTTVTTEQRVSSTNLAVGAPLASDNGEGMYYTGYSDAADSGAAGGNTTGCMANGEYISATGSNGDHAHTVDAHAHAMGHTHTGPSHTHTIDAHTHTVADHNHGMGHFHTGPSHSHTIDSHTHSGPSHAHSGPSHSHSFSGTVSVGHTHTVKVAALNTSTTTSGTSIAGTQSVTGTVGNGGTGTTGYAGTGNTGGTSLTTNAAGTGYTGNAVTSAGASRVYTSDSGSGSTGSASLTTNSAGNGSTSGALVDGVGRPNTGEASPSTNTAGAHVHGMGHTHGLNAHTHTVPAHNHFMRHFHTGAVTITIPEISVTIPSHTHSTTIPDHTHTVSIDSHTHDIEIPEHTHELTPGIYDGPSVEAVAITVDETTVPASAIEGDELDIIAYLAKDENGKITRGTWHTITLTPVATADNANGLTRIEAAVFVQTFIRSQGGGDY